MLPVTVEEIKLRLNSSKSKAYCPVWDKLLPAEGGGITSRYESGDVLRARQISARAIFNRQNAKEKRSGNQVQMTTCEDGLRILGIPIGASTWTVMMDQKCINADKALTSISKQARKSFVY